MRYTAQKMEFSIKDFIIKCDQIRNFLRIWLHLLKKSLAKNFNFCAVLHLTTVQPVQPSWTSNWPEIKETGRVFHGEHEEFSIGKF